MRRHGRQPERVHRTGRGRHAHAGRRDRRTGPSGRGGGLMTWVDLARTTLENEHALLRPITPGDRESLRSIAMDPSIWRYFVTLIETDDDFDAFFDAALADQDAGRRI